MVIETADGNLETVERTLEEYALVVTGRSSPETFLNEEYQILQLRQKLEMAAMEIRWQDRHIRALEADKARQADFFSKQLTFMNDSLTVGLSNATRLIEALQALGSRSADESITKIVDLLISLLRHPAEGRKADEITEALSVIAQRNPSILAEIYKICRETTSGAAGALIAGWIAPLIGILPR